MNRNTLYAIIGALAIAGAVLGYMLYEESKQPTGLEINVDDNSISIEPK